MTNTVPHLVRVYFDPFTLPMLQQLLHFCRHSEEENTTSLTTWQRMTQPGNQLHPRHRHIRQGMAPAREVYEQLMALKAEHGRIEIEVHANQTYGPEALAPFINTLHFLRYPVRQIHLYEDGTREYGDLLRLSKHDDLQSMLTSQQTVLENYLYDTPRTTPLPCPFGGLERALLGMCWHRLYPTRYHMVRPDVLTRLSGLRALADELAPHLERTDWSVFRTLTEHQQGWLFQVLGLDRAGLECTFGGSRPLIFTATTLSCIPGGVAEQGVVRFHQDVIKRIRKTGNPCSVPGDYTLMYKGHPGGVRINGILLKQNRKLVPLPAHLPVEVLLMLGLPLHGFCGVASSAYLSLTKEQIRFVMMPPYNKASREESLRWGLAHLLVQLDIVEEHQVVFYHELFKRGELPFPTWGEYEHTPLTAARAIDDIKSGSGLMPPKKNLILGFYIGQPQDFQLVEKTLDSLLRMGNRCILVIDEAAEGFAAVCELMSTVTRKDLEAFTLSAVQEASVRFDCFVTPPGRAELHPHGYHIAEYGEVGALGTQSTLLVAIANIQRKFTILM